MNPPSAWAVAKRDAPQVAEQLWTFDPPAGPKGRYDPFLPYFWGIWSFSANKPAAKSLLTFLSQRPQVEQLVAAGQGYDLPAFAKLHDFKTWADEGPPKGTLYSYPPREDTDRLDLLRAGPDQHRDADVFAGDDDQDDRALHAAGREHRPGDRLGIRRARGLHARIARPQWASAVGPFGGVTLRISGTMAVASTKQAAMARKASA